MSPTLDRLPFDVLFTIALSLSPEEVRNLSLICRQLRSLLTENSLCRRIVQARAAHTKEAVLAKKDAISYWDALDRICRRREAFANAIPFSACVLAYGSAYIYRHGVLCYLSGDVVRILDIHGSSKMEKVINCSSIMEKAVSRTAQRIPALKIELMHYNDGVLAVHVDRVANSGGGCLLAIDVEASDLDSPRIVARRSPQSSSKLFVRHNRTYLCYGTHTGVGTHGHHEWKIYTISLDPTKHPLPKGIIPLQLEDFAGSDFGTTVAFEIHNGYFYGLTNQTCFGLEEVDWTSFYHCIKFPVNNPVRDAMEKDDRIYRRQHAEGPINDSWTHINLQVDERTNDLMIVEARREWLKGASTQHRTFYTQHVTFPTKKSVPQLPVNDPYVAVLSSDNNPHWAPTQPRYPLHTHPEYGPRQPSSNSPSFILSRTKLRAYSLASSAFLDLVEDNNCCNIHQFNPCIRLRIGSRRLAPCIPVRNDDVDAESKCPNTKGKGKLICGLTSAAETEGSDSDGILENIDYEPPDPKDTTIITAGHDRVLCTSEAKYKYSPIKMWPPPASDAETSEGTKRLHTRKLLHAILSPPLSQPPTDSPRPYCSKQIQGTVDERSLIYHMRKSGSGDNNREGPIILVNFDPAIEIPSSGVVDRFGRTEEKEPAEQILGKRKRETGEQEATWVKLGMGIRVR